MPRSKRNNKGTMKRKKKYGTNFFKNLNRHKMIVFAGLLFLLLFVITSSYSYSYFIKNDVVEEFNIVVGDLNFSLESDEFNTQREVSVSSGNVLEFIVLVTSLNEITSRYQLCYDALSVSGVDVYYVALEQYDASFGKIDSQDSKTIKIRIENNASEDVTLKFGIVGGLSHNEDVEVDSSKVKIDTSILKTVIAFDANGGSVDTLSKTFTFGTTFESLPTPTKKGYSFDGWYTDKTDGEKIESTTVFSDATIEVLYAHWTSVLLVDNVKIGQYIDYPVYYKNVYTVNSGTTNMADDTVYSGWRVLGIEEDDATGEKYVKLTTAGVPLTYKHPYSTTDTTVGETSVLNLTTNFFSTDITTTATDNKFHLCGFLQEKNSSVQITDIDDLKALFDNEFTRTTSDGALMVQSIRNADLKKALDELSNKTDSVIENLTDFTDYELLGIPADDTSGYVAYYSADVEQDFYLWAAFTLGYVVYTYAERGVRPVVLLKSDVIIASDNTGDGTYSNPYKISR